MLILDSISRITESSFCRSEVTSEFLVARISCAQSAIPQMRSLSALGPTVDCTIRQHGVGQPRQLLARYLFRISGQLADSFSDPKGNRNRGASPRHGTDSRPGIRAPNRAGGSRPPNAGTPAPNRPARPESSRPSTNRPSQYTTPNRPATLNKSGETDNDESSGIAKQAAEHASRAEAGPAPGEESGTAGSATTLKPMRLRRSGRRRLRSGQKTAGCLLRL